VLAESIVFKRRESSIRIEFRTLPASYEVYATALKPLQKEQGPIGMVRSQSTWVIAAGSSARPLQHCSALSALTPHPNRPAGMNREALVQELRRKGLEQDYKIPVEFEDGVVTFPCFEPHQGALSGEAEAACSSRCS